MGEVVDVVREGPVARVVMHRAGNNSIAADLMGELRAAFEELGADPDCRVIVLQSAYESNAGFSAIEACPKPVVARINGHALGGGCELTLCCDYRIMVEDGRSRIGQTESALGIIPGAGGTQRLPRLIGRARALPLLYESRRLSAAEAEALGLVNRAVPPEQLDQAVDELAARLARSATLAIALIKDAVNRGLEVPLDEGLAIEARNFARSALSEDAVTGITAFFQKSDPEFKGR